MRAGRLPLLLLSGRRRSRNKYLSKQQREEELEPEPEPGLSLFFHLVSKLSSCCHDDDDNSNNTGHHSPGLLQPSSFFFLSAAVCFLSAPSHPAASFPSSSVGHRGGDVGSGGGVCRRNRRRESCLKCRPKRWWAFPWKQQSQQSVTSSVRGEATGPPQHPGEKTEIG